MSDYGKTLKQLIDFSSVKMYLVAETVGYDVSYISKWCNKGYLPSAKAAPKINGTLARLLSEDITAHCDLQDFNSRFGLQASEEDLESAIRVMLQQAYDSSSRKETTEKTSKAENEDFYPVRTLVHTNEIRRFFRQIVEQQVNGVFIGLIVLSDFKRIDHLQQHCKILFFLRRFVPDVPDQRRVVEPFRLDRHRRCISLAGQEPG